jgi:hypothetical protein
MFIIGVSCRGAARCAQNTLPREPSVNADMPEKREAKSGQQGPEKSARQPVHYLRCATAHNRAAPMRAWARRLTAVALFLMSASDAAGFATAH